MTNLWISAQHCICPTVPTMNTVYVHILQEYYVTYVGGKSPQLLHPKHKSTVIINTPTVLSHTQLQLHIYNSKALFLLESPSLQKELASVISEKWSHTKIFGIIWLLHILFQVYPYNTTVLFKEKFSNK